MLACPAKRGSSCASVTRTDSRPSRTASSRVRLNRRRWSADCPAGHAARTAGSLPSSSCSRRRIRRAGMMLAAIRRISSKTSSSGRGMTRSPPASVTTRKRLPLQDGVGVALVPDVVPADTMRCEGLIGLEENGPYVRADRLTGPAFRPRRAGREEQQVHATEANPRSCAQRGRPRDSAPVHERPVAAAEILDLDPLAVDPDHGVLHAKRFRAGERPRCSRSGPRGASRLRASSSRLRTDRSFESVGHFLDLPAADRHPGSGASVLANDPFELRLGETPANLLF